MGWEMGVRFPAEKDVYFLSHQSRTLPASCPIATRELFFRAKLQGRTTNYSIPSTVVLRLRIGEAIPPLHHAHAYRDN
jgi:hypothetical protein